MDQQRYEKEIEEILERAGAAPPEEPRPGPGNAPPRRRRPRSPGGGPRRLSVKYQYVLFGGIGMVLLGAIFGWLYLFFAGVAMLVLGYVMYYRAPRTGSVESRAPRMWRGRTIDPEDPPER